MKKTKPTSKQQAALKQLSLMPDQRLITPIFRREMRIGGPSREVRARLSSICLLEIVKSNRLADAQSCHLASHITQTSSSPKARAAPLSLQVPT
jgi:hypothetical protein